MPVSCAAGFSNQIISGKQEILFPFNIRLFIKLDIKCTSRHTPACVILKKSEAKEHIYLNNCFFIYEVNLPKLSMSSRSTYLRRWRKAVQHCLRNSWYCSLCVPPIPSTISLFSFIGGGRGFGSRPKIYPKSMWKSLPRC